ncbi:MAG TPA: hypothetical protein VE954_18345 [Oligoflexus sp.]|uniref:hypothetical protein n=1 Tax=Oligoflexus sp. TaxID=1971216 RepID=UPI002D521908|nr:hypothetical protein [Oligoflexus sp.]HYX35062.1 hypothetical protein [Oligoflexus sp.]
MRIKLVSIIVIATFGVSCTKKDKDVDADKNELAAESISSLKDGIWVRIDTGKPYFLSNKKLFQIDSLDEPGTVQFDDGSTIVFSNGQFTDTLRFLSNDLLKVEHKSAAKATPTIFHLLRQGVETATAKGQIKLSSSRLNLTNESMDIKITNTNDSEKSINVSVDSDGNFETPEIESGTYDIEIKNDDAATPTVVENVRIEGPGDNAGIITINDSPHNFKTQLIPRSDFSFNGQTYDATIVVQNFGDNLATGVNYQLTTDDPNLVLIGAQGILDSIPTGSSKTLTFKYQITGLTTESKLMKIKIVLKDTSGNSWEDYVTIEGWKRKLKLHFSTKKNVGISGLAIFENRRTYFFDITNQESIELPEIINGDYNFALSAQNLEQETAYSVGIAKAPKLDLDSFFDTSVFEPNNAEEKSTSVEVYEAVTSYIHIGDIDFYSFHLNADLIPDGTGTAGNPFILKSAAQIDYFNGNFDSISGLNFKLGNDLDLNGRDYGFSVAGDFFIFDGDNHVLSNYKTSVSQSGHLGFFPSVSGGTLIKNLVLKNFDITQKQSAKSDACVGGLIGNFDGKGGFIGGITILNSKITAGYAAGALAGCLEGAAVEDITIADVAIKSEYGSAGGAIGEMKISNARKVKVTGADVRGPIAGGLAGAISGGTNWNDSRVNLSECSVSGEANGGDSGGLAGTGYIVKISNSATSVYVVGNRGGGMVGAGYGVGIENGLATGRVLFSKNGGGLVGGDLQGSVSNRSYTSYWDAATTEVATSEGADNSGLTTAQMQTQATYVGWDFTTIWFPPQPGQYPTLR